MESSHTPTNRRFRRSDDALQHDMNTAAFGAAHATQVSEERQRSQIELIWSELRWHKWLLIALCAGSFGQYVGLGQAVTQAMPFHK